MTNSVQFADNIFINEEDVMLKLRRIYRNNGYSCFKMSKFEEYELYSHNKEFLVSDSVITFNDTNGRLMALKPDVTLSIVKNYSDSGRGVRRLCYNENVYRVSDKTHCYGEIMQTGLECLGDITDYNIFEVLSLAAQSLATISEKCVLNVSHLGILSSVLTEAGISGESVRRILKCISQKNPHTLGELCAELAIPQKTAQLLTFFTSAYGCADDVARALRSLTDNPETLACLDRLVTACHSASDCGACVRLDLSLINDTDYYNGIIFQGYVEGVPSKVLSGGQYDRLMAKMGKKSKAIGFAVYLDLLQRLCNTRPYGVDVLLLYDKNCDMLAVRQRAEALIAEGKSVSAQTEIPDELLYGELEIFGAKTGGAANE